MSDCFFYSEYLGRKVIAHSLENITELIGAVAESFPVFVLRLAPLYLADCSQTWEQLAVKMVGCRNVLSPEVCLYADDV